MSNYLLFKDAKHLEHCVYQKKNILVLKFMSRYHTWNSLFSVTRNKKK